MSTYLLSSVIINISHKHQLLLKNENVISVQLRAVCKDSIMHAMIARRLSAVYVSTGAENAAKFYANSTLHMTISNNASAVLTADFISIFNTIQIIISLRLEKNH